MASNVTVLMTRTSVTLCCMAGLLLLGPSSCTVGPCGVTWLFDKDTKSIPGTPAQPLPTSEFAAAEAAYRSFLPGGQWTPSQMDLVYCLSYGNRGAALSSDFMTHFPGPAPRIITGTGALEFKPGTTVDRETGRQAVVLTLQSLAIRGDHADATMTCATGSMVVTETLELVQRADRWLVTQMQEKSRSYF
jgi:hypothetical protein